MNKKQIAASKVAEALRREFVGQIGRAVELRRFSSGNLAIDRIMGGGVPVGRVVELYGPFSSGKSLLAVHMMSELQKLGGVAIFGDVEGAYDRTFGRAVGLEDPALVYWNPKTASNESEVTLTVEDVTHFFISAWKKVRRITQDMLTISVLDSVAAMSTRFELQEGLAKADLSKARMVSAAARLLNAYAGPLDTLVIINQVREKIGVRFGDPETTPGGRAIPYLASVRLKLSQVRQKKEERGKVIPTGGLCRVICTKNRTAPPLRSATVEVSFFTGVDRYSGLIELLEQEGVVTRKRGGLYQYQGKSFKREDLPQLVEEKPWIVTEEGKSVGREVAPEGEE